MRRTFWRLAVLGIVLFSFPGLAQAEKAYCDLKIEKTVSPSPLVSGQQAVFTIKITNVGTDACPGPTYVVDSGAPGLAFVSASGPGWICIGQTCTYLGSILPGGSATLTYTYTVIASPGASITNCVEVRNNNDRNAANNRVCVSSKVVALPGRCDLTCSVKVSPDPLIAGQPATFTVTVTNVGNAACSLSNQVVVPPISGLSFVSASGVGWTCTQVGGQVICNYPGTIPSNGSATVVFTYNVTASLGTTINFCSNVANKDDTNPGNNECCVRVPVAAGNCDLVCGKKIEPHPVAAGYPVTITVQNVGDSPCPGPTWISDAGITGLTFVSASGPGWTCVGSTCSYAPPSRPAERSR